MPSLPVLNDPAFIAAGDALRVLCAVGAAVLIGLALSFAIRVSVTRPPHMTPVPTRALVYVTAGFALLAISAFGTELGRIGEEVTWRLPSNVLGILLGLTGVGKLMQKHNREHQ